MKRAMVIGLCALSMSTFSLAGGHAHKGGGEDRVQIDWQNPEKYTDVDPVNESRKRFRERTFEKLEHYFEELAQSLPQGQTLHLTVTNLDLAGEVWPASFVGLGRSGNDVRLIKDVYIPRMEFSYTLKDASGAVLKEDNVYIKDMAFHNRLNKYFDQDSLRYEKVMIEDWFDDTFASVVAKN